MYMNTRYLLSLIIFVVSMSFLDFSTNKYYKNAVKNESINVKIKLGVLLLVHNIVYFIQYFTILFIIFNYKKISPKLMIIYQFSLFGTMLHWITNDRRCILTELTNDILKIKRSRRMGMRDPYGIIFNIYYENDGTGTLRDNLYWTYILGTCTILTLLIFKANPNYL